jgi:hypothetical protein
LPNQFDTYSDHDWEILSNKLSMLIEEFEVFKTLWNNLLTLETWHERNIRGQIDNRAELQKVLDSAQATFGFFKKQSKEEKLDELRRKEQTLAIDVGVGNELLALVYQVIAHHEVPLLKGLKKERFDKTVYEFSQARIQELEKELLLWQTINLPDEVPEDTDAPHEGYKVDRQDFRFTELPRMREDNP